MALEPTEELDNIIPDILEPNQNLDGNLSSDSILSKDVDGYTGPKTTLFRDPKTGKQYPILGKYSMNLIAENILHYLDSSGFANVLVTGGSGSGKSTFANQLVHLIHTKRSFNINWYKREEIKSFVKIVNGLTKGINQILVFDDASFALEDLKKEQLSDIAKRLTYIRHTIKAQVIVLFNCHYSKSLNKFMRVCPFKILTSIENEEMQSFQDLFGRNSRYKLNDFARYYKHQMLRGGWQIKLSDWDNSFLDYKTDHPFRICLVNEINDLHFSLFLKDSCEQCLDPEDRISEVSNPIEFINHLVNAYGKEKTSAILNYYSFSQHGIKTLDNNRASLWNLISKLDQKNHYEWSSIMQEAKKLLKHRRSRSYIKHNEVKEIINEINDSNNSMSKVTNSTDEQIKIESSDIQNETL